MNKFSINKWESMRVDEYVEVPVDGLEGVSMKIKRTLSLEEMLQFVADVMSTCFSDDGDFRPELRNFAIKIAVLTSYASFNMPKDVGKQYDLIYNTNAVHQVLCQINQEQFSEICLAIDKRMEHEMRKIESQAAMQAQEVLARVTSLTEQFADIFDGMDASTLSDTLSAINNIGNMDERALAHAVINEQEPQPDDGKVVMLPRD